MSAPDIWWKGVFHDVKRNSNKWWAVKWWSDGTYEASYGRIGEHTAMDSKTNVPRYFVEDKIREKVEKGYHEVPLATEADVVPTVSSNGYDSRLLEIAQYIASQAGQSIRSHTAVSIDQIHPSHIQKARGILNHLQLAVGNWDAQVYQVEQYLNTIPTHVPFRRMTEEDVIPWFTKDLQKWYDQLDELEANLRVHRAQEEGDTALFAGLPVEIEVMEQADEDYADVVEYVLSTAHGGSRIRNVYRVTIHPERAAYELEGKGNSKIMSLFHGTKGHYVQKILSTGLILPQSGGHGLRFGPGIYFADQAQKSQNYASSYNTTWAPMFIADVKVGRQLVHETQGHYTSAPSGYDSIHGIKAWSGHDEFVIWRPSQQTVRALVIFE